MIDHTIVLFRAILTLRMSTIGMAAAAPGEGRPSELPDAVSDVVSNLLDGITEPGGVLNGVAELVGSLVPDVGGASGGLPG